MSVEKIELGPARPDPLRALAEHLPRPLRFLGVGGIGLTTDICVFTILIGYAPRPLLMRLFSLALATLVSSYAATVELQISDRLSPFGYKLFQGLAIALGGVALMWGAATIAGGPVRFGSVVVIWLGVTWLTLRYGLTREDRAALGGLSRRLRLPT